MTTLLNLLKDGSSRSVEQLAEDLGTTVEDIQRRIEFLEKSNFIHKITTPSALADADSPQKTAPSPSNGCKNCGGGSSGGCSSCKGCSASCSCSNDTTFKNMNTMWEVVNLK